jgi:hypothetical protein
MNEIKKLLGIVLLAGLAFGATAQVGPASGFGAYPQYGTIISGRTIAAGAKSNYNEIIYLMKDRGTTLTVITSKTNSIFAAFEPSYDGVTFQTATTAGTVGNGVSAFQWNMTNGVAAAGPCIYMTNITAASFPNVRCLRLAWVTNTIGVPVTITNMSWSAFP